MKTLRGRGGEAGEKVVEVMSPFPVTAGWDTHHPHLSNNAPQQRHVVPCYSEAAPFPRSANRIAWGRWWKKIGAWKLVLPLVWMLMGMVDVHGGPEELFTLSLSYLLRFYYGVVDQTPNNSTIELPSPAPFIFCSLWDSLAKLNDLNLWSSCLSLVKFWDYKFALLYKDYFIFKWNHCH